MDIFRMSDNKYVMAALPITMIEIMWPKIEPFIQSVADIANGEITCDGVKRRALSGETLIVVICKGPDVIAANVLDIMEFDSGLRALYIPIVGGSEMDEWLDQFFLVAKAIAKDFNCTELRGLATRKGWLRRLKDMGWVEITSVIKCDVGE